MFLVTCFLVLGIATASQAASIDTCGYSEGDPKNPRTADPGFDCRVDAKNGLWGFCPTTVALPVDCGLAGVCVDSHSCTKGCGRLTRRTDITTVSCDSTQFCSTVLSIAGRDQSYEYIACGAKAGTDRLFPSPNAASATTTPSSPTSVPSTSFTISISQSTPTPLETSAGSAETSVTTDPISIPSKQESANIGAIVGGVLGGLALICLTILGTVLIRRKHGAQGKAISPPDHTHYDRNGFTDNVPLYAHDSEDLQKYYHREDSQGPVEMYSGPHPVNVEPVELPGQVQLMDTTRGIK
ncbi:hypothetical protein HBH56_208680 [Parastagonospora nodorum]|uniref:Mid2 domain-containing protein n=1 Tax=Phaeosphaeria nodorum (strain SN15 / ATCC MYA-4574 / FGSC 10173) TaxID=321614 RepID=A0A7U2F6I2_PHANO|nr:hypothetical protein HBH56_208680 [Parastagonospora nodorum]QRC99640.1 hypothetical protein JI435_150360 [Parastagonospora nodorum SN15]KAH3923597.1 hypothetical protein HBH54_207550 [Parastagonospora nodorum]KAH3960420.1 hypothetical protein HBH51_192070 [Parastagonospora nodorum]KAH4091755.1 hypothetical protein HBH46_185660 [Parastagonospora nodorum]